MRSYSASRDGTRRREADPYHLWFAAGRLYMIAHCHLRKGGLTLCRGTYPLDLAYRPSLSDAARIKDKSWHPSQETKLLKDGRLKMTLKVADNDELVGWILSLGGEVRVIRPEPFKARI